MSGEPELTIQDIAERANVSEKTVHLWIDKGLLPAIEYPGSGKQAIRRVAAADFETFRQRCKKDVIPIRKVSAIRAFSRRGRSTE